jgi:hypothetical protein
VPNDEFGVKLQSMVLADHASVREGLLTMVSGGVTRVTVPSFPTGVNATVALLFYMPADAFGVMHSGALTLRYADGDCEPIARADIALRADSNPQLRPGEPVYFPATVPLLGLLFDRAGMIDINLSINGALTGHWTFWLDLLL